MIIALDFDGTAVTHEYPEIGKDIGAVPVLKELLEKGTRSFYTRCVLVKNCVKRSNGSRNGKSHCWV